MNLSDHQKALIKLRELTPKLRAGGRFQHSKVGECIITHVEAKHERLWGKIAIWIHYEYVNSAGEIVEAKYDTWKFNTLLESEAIELEE